MQFSTHEALSIPTKERRNKARSDDGFYRLVIGLNAFAWLLLLSALIVFHYARPEFITGLQTYWGIEGRDFWSQEHLARLLVILQSCLALGVVVAVMRKRRSRRRSDTASINAWLLASVSAMSLALLYVAL